MLLLGLSWNISAQKYMPIDTLDTAIRTSFVKDYHEIHSQFKTSLEKKYKNPLRKELLKTFEIVHLNFIKSIEEGAFSYDPRFIAKLEEILQVIKDGNPDLPKNLKLMLSKRGELNAYNLGEGTVVVNMGVFQYLSNEDQLAGIIGHEVAHQQLNHVLQTQERRFNIDRSKSTVAVQEVKKQRFNRGAKALDYFREVLYAEGEELRKQELEADKLGVELIKNTTYDTQGIVSAFQLMKEYDTLRFTGVDVGIYQRVFDLPNQAFNEKWLLKEDFSVYQDFSYTDMIDQKSLKTHPDLDLRITALSTTIDVLEPVVATPEFTVLKEIARLEQVPNLYFNREYGAATYMCLLNIQQGRDVAYYQEWLGKVFVKIYEARKSYKLNRYLDIVTPTNQSNSYQQFLSFMWNLNLNEIKGIADFYSTAQTVNE